jgi:hypothetical protein
MTDCHRVELDGSLGLRDAVRIAAILYDAIDRHASVEVAMTTVTEVDLSIVQLLVAARRTALESGKALCLTGDVTAPVRATLVRLGFLGPAGVRSDPERLWMT